MYVEVCWVAGLVSPGDGLQGWAHVQLVVDGLGGEVAAAGWAALPLIVTVLRIDGEEDLVDVVVIAVARQAPQDSDQCCHHQRRKYHKYLQLLRYHKKDKHVTL
jgi:hypothetical protein